MIEFQSMATKSAPPPPGASITITSSLVTFFTLMKISEKLDEKNFLVWRQQVEPMINVHNLQNYIIFPEIPKQFLTPNRNSGKENLAYHNWINQDQWLLSWLQSSVFSSIMMRVLGCVHMRTSCGSEFTIISKNHACEGVLTPMWTLSHEFSFLHWWILLAAYQDAFWFACTSRRSSSSSTAYWCDPLRSLWKAKNY